MDQPPPSSPKQWNLLVLAICLSGALLAWRVSEGLSPDTRRTVFSAPAPGSSEEANPPAVSAHPEAKTEEARPAQPAPEVRPEMRDVALSEPDSPVISTDLDENREWARRHPATAAAWLEAAPVGGQRAAIAETVCLELMQARPVAAIKLAESCLGDGKDDALQCLLENMAQQWAERNIKAAGAWALAKAPGEQRDRLLQRLAFVMSKTKPEEAGRLITREMAPGPLQDEAAMTVLHQWTRTDAGAALAWAESFPPGGLRDRALEEVVNLSAVSSETKFSGINPE